MAYEIQKRGSDCAVVSLTNYTGKDYATVMTVVTVLSGRSEAEILRKGTPDAITATALSVLTGKHVRVSMPRRGQENCNGVVSWHKPGRKNGHMTAVVDGWVFDTDGRMVPVARYRKETGYCIRKVYSVEDVPEVKPSEEHGIKVE